MTMSAVPIDAAPDETELPPHSYPMLVMVITNDLTDNAKPTIHWVVSKPHPFVPGMNVLRMFVDRGGYFEAYSVSSDGRVYMRDLVPMSQVRLAQQAMPLDIFADELDLAEEENEGGPNLDPDPGPDPDPDPAQPVAPNGQIAS